MKDKTIKLPFSAAVLKWIALITMIADHVGASFLKYYFISYGKTPVLKVTYEVLRDVGRIAFPIYIFLLIEGYTHTRNVYRYILRMGLFALISEIPFNLAFYDHALFMDKQNVFFTLFIGLLVVHAMDRIAMQGGIESARGGPANEKHLPRSYFVLSDIGLMMAGAMLAFVMYTDYNAIGVLAICAVYLLRKRPVIAGLVCCLILMGSSVREAFSFIAVIPISLYNGSRGRQLKYLFYLAYPVHLLILYLIRIAVL